MYEYWRDRNRTPHSLWLWSWFRSKRSTRSRLSDGVQCRSSRHSSSVRDSVVENVVSVVLHGRSLRGHSGTPVNRAGHSKPASPWLSTVIAVSWGRYGAMLTRHASTTSPD